MPLRPQMEQEARLNEPEEIRKLSKKDLHARLANEYYLPAHTTKGVNRTYLVSVFTGAAFRISILEFKRWDAELTPNMKKKQPIICGVDAVAKINQLLTETG